MSYLVSFCNCFFSIAITSCVKERAYLSSFPMPGHLFWIWVSVCLMVQFPPEFVINGAVLVLVWSVSLFWMAVSPGVPRVGCACLDL